MCGEKLLLELTLVGEIGPYCFIIDHVAGEIIRLITSVRACVCLSVYLWVLSSLNCLTFDLDFWHEG